MEKMLLQFSATSLDTLNPMVSSFKPHFSSFPYFPICSSLKLPFPYPIPAGSQPPSHVAMAVARLLASVVTRRSESGQGAKSLESASGASEWNFIVESLGNSKFIEAYGRLEVYETMTLFSGNHWKFIEPWEYLLKLEHPIEIAEFFGTAENYISGYSIWGPAQAIELVVESESLGIGSPPKK